MITAGGNDVAYVGALTKGSIANAVAGRVGVLPERVAERLRGSVSYLTRPGQFDVLTATLTEIVRQVRARAPKASCCLSTS